MHKNLDLVTVRLFKWFKIFNIKRLKKMRRMSKYIKNQNIIIFAMNFKSIRIIALVTIKNKKLIYIFYARFCVLIEIFYLIHIQLIIYLIIIINSNLPIAENCWVFVLEKKVIFCLNYNKRRDCLILKIRFLNNKNPFSIAKLC